MRLLGATIPIQDAIQIVNEVFFGEGWLYRDVNNTGN